MMHLCVKHARFGLTFQRRRNAVSNRLSDERRNVVSSVFKLLKIFSTFLQTVWRSTRVSMSGYRPIWLLSAFLLTAVPAANSELTPPYFNLAEGRKIVASSTCGVDNSEPELYCKLVGSHTDDQQNNTLFDYHDDHFHTEGISRQGHVIQGQVRETRVEDEQEFKRNSSKLPVLNCFVNNFGNSYHFWWLPDFRLDIWILS